MPPIKRTKIKQRKDDIEVSARKNNSFKIRFTALVIGFFINVFGNSLTIASNMGAEPWAAAAQNLYEVLGFSVGTFVFIFGVGNAIFNQCLLNKIDVLRFIGEVLYIGIFSWFVDVFLDMFKEMGINDLSMGMRGFLSCLGVALFCSGISLYQRSNIIMHPNDDTSNLIRFRCLHGSAILSQIVDILPSILIIAVCAVLLHGKLYSINVGTVFSLICNGFLIKYSDRYFWPNLKHNKRKKHNVVKLVKSIV